MPNLDVKYDLQFTNQKENKLVWNMFGGNEGIYSLILRC